MNPTVPWYITFPIGGPYGGQYAEIRVPSLLTRAEQQMRARLLAQSRYGSTGWAFDYPPEKFDSCIARYDMKLREVVVA